VSARSLLSRPISKDPVKIPKIIHQTWFPAGSNMSERAQSWVQTMREQNPDWEWVLWDDETNNLLVQTYFPWFWDIYSGLPKEILRADLVRNFYMYLFGGYVLFHSFSTIDADSILMLQNVCGCRY
jgi:mannosyltransferase OCH1-like enzyme